jgi:uncharacterized repeat protein (TIGR03803 family)
MPRFLPLSIVLLAASTSLSAQTFRVLHNFGSKPGDPTGPRFPGVISQSRGGNMFSSADDHWTDNNGTAFRITPSGTLTVVHRFTPPGGIRPVGGLTLATDGQYYGTNALGGLYGRGNVFKMKQGGGLTVLHTFTAAEGGIPIVPPIESVAGDFYGTTAGDASHPGCIYRITKSGEFTVLHLLSGSDGAQSNAPLVQGSDFFFYGTATIGGAHDYGTIFRISADGTFEVLYNFDGTHGRWPITPLIQAKDGNFYGTTQQSGTQGGGGVVFKLTPGRVYTVLHDFTGGSDGNNLAGGLVQATDGNLYGVNNQGGQFGCGVLFRITTAGTFKTMHAFDGGHGCQPQVGMMQHTNGILYGTTALGGSVGDGTFYSLDLGLSPFVTYLPTYGRAGALVQILGQGFTAGSQVFFNGTPAASPIVVYPTYLRVVVPSGATTGPITVTTDNGTLTSNKVFIVHP